MDTLQLAICGQNQLVPLTQALTIKSTVVDSEKMWGLGLRLMGAIFTGYHGNKRGHRHDCSCPMGVLYAI